METRFGWNFCNKVANRPIPKFGHPPCAILPTNFATFNHNPSTQPLLFRCFAYFENPPRAAHFLMYGSSQNSRVTNVDFVRLLFRPHLINGRATNCAQKSSTLLGCMSPDCITRSFSFACICIMFQFNILSLRNALESCDFCGDLKPGGP